MRSKIKKNIYFIAGLLVIATFFAAGITLLEYMFPETLVTKLVVNLVTYVFTPLFIGFVVSLMPEVWKQYEKYDDK